MSNKFTFANEFNWLLQNLPSALEFENEDKIEDIVENYFSNSFTNIENSEAIPIEFDYFDNLFLDEAISSDFNSDKSKLEFYFNPQTTNQEVIKQLIVDFGHNAFGMYLPMHKYFTNKKYPWGIYLFPEIINWHSNNLYSKFQDLISAEDIFKLFAYCIYRHELFHFHTEQFATALETVIRKPMYIQYIKNIYSKYVLTENWLEEALAEASVLNSRLVSNRSNINSKVKNLIYEFDLKNMPPGYRDYKCKKFGGIKKAHQVLASQIVNLEKYNPTPTSLLTIKSFYSSNDKKVPLFFVNGLKEILRVDRNVM